MRNVLIESDWNLKVIEPVASWLMPASINRIRLEFKVISPEMLSGRDLVLIESDWNLKADRADRR